MLHITILTILFQNAGKENNMGKEMVKAKFPVMYQLYLYAKSIMKRRAERNKETQFYQMTDFERMGDHALNIAQQYKEMS